MSGRTTFILYISITSLNQSSSGSNGKKSDRNSEEGPGSNSGQISVYPWTKNEANARSLVAQLVRASDLHSEEGPGSKPVRSLCQVSW